MINLDERADWCLSGGADGADLAWGMCAGKLGHGVIHFSFEGHRSQAPASELVMLTKAQLRTADEHCHRANQTLRRRFPARSPHTTDLLRRDWYQVVPAESCYAVSTLDLRPGPTIPLGTTLPVNTQVRGGTAWAVEFFKNRHNREPCNCYVFDQVTCYWFQWQGRWVRIYQPPRPSGIYAGIGSRDLLPIGKLAIHVLMNYRSLYDSD